MKLLAEVEGRPRQGFGFYTSRPERGRFIDPEYVRCGDLEADH